MRIIRMLRFGSGRTVKLEWGCGFRATLDEALRDQLVIGKPVTCLECGAGAAINERALTRELSALT